MQCTHGKLRGPSPAMIEDDDWRWVCDTCLRRFDPWVEVTLSCGHSAIVHDFSSLFDYPECKEQGCEETVTILAKRKVAI